MISAAFFLLISGYRFGDSGHALSTMSLKGGKARHPVHLKNSYDRFSVIVTSRVLPPYQGDARVVLEGEPAIFHEMYFSEPVVNLGLSNGPFFNENTIYNLTPGDRIAMWLYMKDTEGTINADRISQYTLAFYDTKTHRPVLKVPLVFESEEALRYAGSKGDDQGAECR